ncbi:hypothetical protein [Microvirga antarctica]|uniref:hypothetical protein n=1 Tax=Microvirga antarctica TaxID=2819233 RepID=UPI001B312AA9|nr:hypothetical protein [Microvirga antarctica]
MLGFEAIAEATLGSPVVNAVLLDLRGTLDLVAYLSSELFEVLASPTADIVYVAEISISTINDGVSA